MRRSYFFWTVLLAGLVWLAGPQPAGSSEVAESETLTLTPQAAETVPVEPRRIEVLQAPAPTRMLADEGLLYLERLREERRAEHPPAVDATDREGKRARAGVSRTYEVERPPVVNSSDVFRFEDATARHPAARPLLDMQERRAAVDAFRRDAARKGRSAEGRGATDKEEAAAQQGRGE